MVGCLCRSCVLPHLTLRECVAAGNGARIRCTLSTLPPSIVLCQSMLEADEVVFGSTRKRWRQVPGWNEFVRDAHHTAREAFLSWRAHGSPRQGHLAENMRHERARFKLALRWCRAHEQSLRAQSLADKLAAGDSTNFWRELKALG